ncbi:two-component system, chemotaxis family, response regulator CheV [Lachnospiraceae bacterium MD308]|nr:two-component system, chemotaxis family, response regulator CheV [Lachnospiraceae bacterium MD308]MCI8502269.1 chemotaxis protein CheV [Dorea sp.]
MANTEILLESGTNEIEIMEFMIYGELYGINVAKVKEIMMSDKVKPMPHAHSSVEGIFKPRDTMLTVVDLPFYLTGQQTERQPRDLFVITNFNKMNIAFRVQSVVGIQRISWNDIQKPDKTLNKGEEGVATGIAQCGGELVTILDFEKIVAEIAPETSIQIDEIDALGERQKNYARIICVEDSILLAKLIERALRQAGYVNLVQFNNGQEAWNYLHAIKDSDPDELREQAALIITDIEMPKMDGHRLTKLVKSDSNLKQIPLIIFSSLISPEMQIKGREIGADEQLSKPEIGHLVTVMDELLTRWDA